MSDKNASKTAGCTFGSALHEFILDEKRYDLRQTRPFLLTIGEAGNVLALDKRLGARRIDDAAVPRRRGKTRATGLPVARKASISLIKDRASCGAALPAQHYAVWLSSLSPHTR